MSLFAHHTEAVFRVEIMGREYPDGMTEHGIAFGILAISVGLMVYGLFAVVRDWRRRRRAGIALPG